jgi:uncharacterized circularly permuted ATP-grasp superfamily protein
MFVQPNVARDAYSRLFGRLSRQDPDRFATKSALAGDSYLAQGITFSHDGAERVFPFDLLPRLIDGDEWATVEEGLKQRVRALDAFIADVYGPQRALRDGVVPRARVSASRGYVREAAGIFPVLGRYVHIAGIDLVRDAEGRWVVLEDNLRNPSGLSYVLQNRVFMRRVFPEAFTDYRVRPVGHAPMLLRQALADCAPGGRAGARMVVLTPSNSECPWWRARTWWSAIAGSTSRRRSVESP